MRADLWKALLRRIPADQFDNLVLMTAQGTEINVQDVLRMEEDVIVLRGRLAGSTDAGRTFFVPYEHFDHLGFQKPLTDPQLQALLGEAPPAARPPSAAAEAPPDPAPVPAPQPEPAAAPPAAVTPPPPAGTADPGLLARVPSRSEIIQRLRQRTAAREGGNSPPKQ
jgi:hypothetical protein